MSDIIEKIPNLELIQLQFVLKNKLVDPKDKSVLEKLMKGVKQHNMVPYYESLVLQLGIPREAALVTQMQGANEAELSKIEVKLLDAQENLGETETTECMIAKASHYAKIGDKVHRFNEENAITTYNLAISKTGPLGHRIDMFFALIRIGFFFNDNELIGQSIEKVKVYSLLTSLIEEGGDWDRRNRLKSYQGIFLISKRDFANAAELLLDTLGTFTSTELMDYKDFVQYAVITAALTLSRPDFKEKVLNAPEILEVIHEIPHLADYANSLYNCQYTSFFKALAEMEQKLKVDNILHAHYRYYVREMRIRVYGQLLESYRSLTIASMANSFGVSEKWIDDDLSQFISAGRLNAVIDKVNGIVETNRPDAKNAQYQASIKQGDLLLNRIQKLSRVINV